MTATATTSRSAGTGVSALPLQLLAEVALAAVSVVTVLALRRVFIGTGWFPPLALQVVAAHALAALLRRRGVPLLASIAITATVGALAICWIYAGAHTTFGVPSRDTLDHLANAISDALTAFPDVKAQTEALDGFLIASSVAVWLGAILADWAAFRVEAPLEATLPSATLFILAAVLGADVDRVLLTGVWIACVFAFVLFRRAQRLGIAATWVGDRRAAGPRTLVLLGAGLALSAVTVAALVGPRLPGAGSAAIVSLTDIGKSGPGTRVTVSPLVDIRSRLIDQADVEVFSVRSSVRDYWRLTSLDHFDGRIWSSNGSYGKAAGTLDEGVPVDTERLTFEQAFQINALAQIWLPAAYEPQAIESATPVRYDEVSGTLIVDTDVATSDDITYRVVSALPEFAEAQLASASTEIPPDIANVYLDLPGDFPDSVRALAQQITAEASSAYEASRMLQDWFRSEFTYDLGVGAGHDDRAMERFLFELKRGYCEQFAGSFAAMARSLGIPARVAVGFTPGTADPTDPTLYRVRGENAHAWPEVFLGQYGWVKFEPTPGRGAPFAESYTGVLEQQVAQGQGGTGVPTTAVTPPSVPIPGAPSTTSPDGGGRNLDALDQGAGSGGGRARPNPWPARLAVSAAVLVGLMALYLALMLVVTVGRRRRRHRAAVEARAQVALAWEESLDALRRAGAPARTAETQRETATRLSARLPDLETPLRTLAITVEDATFAPRSPEPEVGMLALELAREIEAVARASMSTGERFQARFHPRRLLDRT